MGGGDLNMKKSWHPLLIKNQERVWKEEQKAAEEQKKLGQLKKELEEERQLQELRRIQDAMGGKKRTERLDWMYAAGPNQSNSAKAQEEEDFLLGKKRVDALIETSTPINQDTFIDTMNPNANTYRDTQSKIREDPLLMIKRMEQSNIKAIVTNPIKMKELKEKSQKKDKKHKKKKDKKGKEDKKDRHDRDSSPYGRHNRDRSISPHSRHNRDRSISPHSRHNRDRSISPHSRHNRDRSISPHSRHNRDRSISPYGRHNRDRSISPHGKHNRDRSISPHGKYNRDRSVSPHDRWYSGSRKRFRDHSREQSPSPYTHKHRKRSSSPPSKRGRREYDSHREIDNGVRSPPPRRNHLSSINSHNDNRRNMSGEAQKRLQEMMDDARKLAEERKIRIEKLERKEKEEEKKTSEQLSKMNNTEHLKHLYREVYSSPQKLDLGGQVRKAQNMLLRDINDT